MISVATLELWSLLLQWTQLIVDTSGAALSGYNKQRLLYPRILQAESTLLYAVSVPFKLHYSGAAQAGGMFYLVPSNCN